MNTIWKRRLAAGTLALGLGLGGGATLATPAPAHAGQIVQTVNHTVTGKTAGACKTQLNKWMQKTRADQSKWGVKLLSSCTYKAAGKYQGRYTYKKLSFN